MDKANDAAQVYAVRDAKDAADEFNKIMAHYDKVDKYMNGMFIGFAVFAVFGVIVYALVVFGIMSLQLATLIVHGAMFATLGLAAYTAYKSTKW